MTMRETTADQEWGRLAEVEEGQREAQMLARYTEVAALPEEERQQRLRAMAEAEYALPDELLRPFTKSRVRVWLQMEPEAARTVARSYDRVMERMPGPVAMRRVAIVQTLAREFPQEDQQRLRDLVPGVFVGRDRQAQMAVDSPPPRAVEQPRKKPWWAFWRR